MSGAGQGGGRDNPEGPRSQGAPDQRTLDVLCPCCETRLRIDAATGVVLAEDRKKKKGPSKSFEVALDEEKARRAASDSIFGKALQSQKDQQSLLDRKFEEAMKKAAEEPDQKPPHPFDTD